MKLSFEKIHDVILIKAGNNEQANKIWKFLGEYMFLDSKMERPIYVNYGPLYSRVSSDGLKLEKFID